MASLIERVLAEKQPTFKLPDSGLRNLRCLVRVDYNVPLDANGQILNDRRIRLSLETIRLLIQNNCKVILMTHIGQPKGKFDAKLKTDVVAQRLAQLIGQPVKKISDCVGDEVEKIILNMNPREIYMLENLRFHAEEEMNDPFFAKQLANLGEVYINDAFGSCHRKHASTFGVTQYLPSFAGFLVDKEVKMLSRVVAPEHPFVVLLGGAKVSDKILLIDNLLEKADQLLIGGAMMFTFVAAQGHAIGKSLVEKERIPTAIELLDSPKIITPTDVVAAKSIDKEGTTKQIYDIANDDIGLDIGPETIAHYKGILMNAKTVFWNGPMGMFEKPAFAKGTFELAQFLSSLKAQVIIGGGDSAEAIEKLGLVEKFAHVSTGGGASLEFIQAGDLPCLAPLRGPG